MEAVTEALTQGGFSLELNDDQRDVREWVHGLLFGEWITRDDRNADDLTSAFVERVCLEVDPGLNSDWEIEINGLAAVVFEAAEEQARLAEGCLAALPGSIYRDALLQLSADSVHRSS